MQTLPRILDDAASQHPDRPLYVFPETRWRTEESLTYGQLARLAAAAADVLSESAKPGDRALLLCSTGTAFWEAFMGCLARGIIAVPLNIPSLNRSSEFLQSVCDDCAPSLLVMDDDTAALFDRRRDRHPYFAGIRTVTPNDWRDRECDYAPHEVPSDSTAFFQYTSGSTSHPKGVQITHGNVLSNLRFIQQHMELPTDTGRGVTWLPHYHDMGLVGSYLGALYTRSTTWCVPPEEFALRPVRWLQLISEHHADISGGPDFAWRVCVERIPDDQLDGLDLSSLRVAFVGAERVCAETLQQFAERFAPCGFRADMFFPCYGLGESTLMVSGGPVRESPIVRSVSSSALFEHRLEPPASAADTTRLCASGRTFDGCDVLITDVESGQPVADDVIGEVVTRSPSVTPGYFRRPELNAELFRDVKTGDLTRRFLRTGDLGFLSDGALFITGRLRELMIVRGRNLYPDDVEERVCEAHEAIAAGGAVAFSAERAGEESLIIAAELTRAAMRMDNADDVLTAVRHRVTEAFGVTPAEILLLRPASVPRTSSGKPRRLAVRASYLDDSIATLFR